MLETNYMHVSVMYLTFLFLHLFLAARVPHVFSESRCIYIVVLVRAYQAGLFTEFEYV